MIEPAVSLGVKQLVDQWPPIKSYAQLMREKLDEPDVLIEGILHRGGKLLLGAGSKSYKSWGLIDLGVSMHAGIEWWGHKCNKSKVLFINFEIHEWSFKNRLADVSKARGLTDEQVNDFDVWTLRGHAADLTLIRPLIEKHIDGKGYQAIILDPNYMLMGERDENSAGDMASLMNEFEALAVRHNLSVILSHHFSKGNKSGSEAIDRFSGSGVFARNPDSLVVLTAHEEDEKSFTCEITLRNFPPVDSFVVQWHYPLFKTNFNLNPDKLKRPGAHKSIDDDRFLKEMGSKDWQAGDLTRHIMEKCKVSESTAYRYLKRLTKAKKILLSNCLYTADQTTF
jgi:hypothetical protein